MTFLTKILDQMRHGIDWFNRRILGQHGGKSAGSNGRRLFSRITIIFIAIFICDALWTWATGAEALLLAGASTAIVATAWAILFFAICVVSIPLMTDKDWQPNAPRLLTDIFISTTVTIIGFGLLFAELGITHATQSEHLISDFFYFSAVTFSTLGYGDFAPAIGARRYAALLALIGNLHLGMIVGALYYKTQQR